MTNSSGLCVSHLLKSFGGNKVSNDVSFEAKKGEVTCLVGPNGAGKTTIFNLISGFARPDSGAVSVDGKNITGLPPHKLLQHGVARTFQHLRLFNELTVFENLYLGVKGIGETFFKSFFSTKKTPQQKAAVNEVENLLQEYHLGDMKNEVVGRLPYGQQKLVSLARALISKPEYLLLDEGTSGVDPAVLMEMTKSVRSLPDRGVSVLMIEHNMDVVKELADTLIFLHHGQVLASGTPEEIVNNKQLTAIYFGEQ